MLLSPPEGCESMAMQITVEGQGEAIVRARMERGDARTPEELVERALRAYSGGIDAQFSLGRSSKSASEAVADILQVRSHVLLGGLSTKDLAHEGHKH